MSAQVSGQPANLRAIGDPSVDLGIPGGTELLAFTDALMSGDGLEAARDRLVAVVGEQGAVRAALTAGNFQMMNRIVDATGIPVPASMQETFADVGLETARRPTL